MSQWSFSQDTRKRLTHEDVAATGITLGEHNREQRQATVDRALGRVIFLLVVLTLVVGSLVVVTG